VYETCVAAEKSALPNWFAFTPHEPVPLVMVMLALVVAEPVAHADPDHVSATFNPESDVHDTLNVPS
jgi:hypothetical protein